MRRLGVSQLPLGVALRPRCIRRVIAVIPDSNGDTVQITGYNYSDMYYANDGVDPFADAFDDGFDDGLS